MKNPKLLLQLEFPAAEIIVFALPGWSFQTGYLDPGIKIVGVSIV
jgi:hypothetical protein